MLSRDMLCTVLASFGTKDANVTLSIDWQQLGLDPTKIKTLRAPALVSHYLFISHTMSCTPQARGKPSQPMAVSTVQTISDILGELINYYG